MCGGSATRILSPAPGQCCAYTSYCVFPCSLNLCGIAGSCDFQRCAPVALCVNVNRVLTIAVSSSTCMPWGRGVGGEGGMRDLGFRRLGASGVGGVCAVSVVASTTVQGLQAAAWAICWRQLGLSLSSYPDICEE